MLEDSCKPRGGPAVAGAIDLKQLLARSPEEAERLSASFPTSLSKTTAIDKCQQGSEQLGKGPSNQRLTQHQHTSHVFYGNSKGTGQSESLTNEDLVFKQPENIQSESANTPTEVQTQETSHNPCKSQDHRETSKRGRMASLDEIKEMVAAAEQLAMPAAEEERLDRGKRARYEGTYKEPDGKEF